MLVKVGQGGFMSAFKGKIVVITGAGAGIGKALCEQLAQQGATVIATDINMNDCQAVVDNINKNSSNAQALKLDVSNAQEVQNLIDKVVNDYKNIDYIFNNAGFGMASEVQDMELQHWQRIIDVNLFGVIYGTTAAYKAMIKQGFGHIVNIASLAGLVGSPTMTAYATTKSAVIGLSNSLRVEASHFGIKVSVVCPGFIQTKIFDSAVNVNITKERLLSIIPFKLLTVDDAARRILSGVTANKAIIVFPFYAKFAWWLTRFSPTLIDLLHANTVRLFRQNKS